MNSFSACSNAQPSASGLDSSSLGAPPSRILDGGVIDSLKEIMGKDFGLLIDTYRSDFRLRLTSMIKALADQDTDELCRAAHSLKGSSGNLGARPVEELCLALEADARLGNIDRADSLVSLIRSTYDALLPELDQLTRH